MKKTRTALVGICALLAAGGIGLGQATMPSEGTDAAPLPFPIYVASPISGALTIDGQLTEPAWRETALGWGLSHAMEPNVPCPDATLFRIGYSDKSLLIALACYKRPAQDDLPKQIWRPQEPEMIDTQAVPRHDRERGVTPPVNTADVLIAREGRTITLSFAPPAAPTVKVHDAVGERPLQAKMEHAYQGGPDDGLWTVEVRVEWDQLGLTLPAPGEDWAFNVYRDIRFFSNWSFIAWMRDWAKAEYSRYDLTERFGRIIFAGGATDAASTEQAAVRIAGTRGRVRAFTTEALWLVEPRGQMVLQRYPDRLEVLQNYAKGLLAERQRIGNDLPYHPFYVEKKPREHLALPSRQLARLQWAIGEKPLWDDPACGVALISHAVPEAREGLFAYKKERLYRGLFE